PEKTWPDGPEPFGGVQSRAPLLHPPAETPHPHNHKNAPTSTSVGRAPAPTLWPARSRGLRSSSARGQPRPRPSRAVPAPATLIPMTAYKPLSSSCQDTLPIVGALRPASCFPPLVVLHMLSAHLSTTTTLPHLPQWTRWPDLSTLAPRQGWCDARQAPLS